MRILHLLAIILCGFFVLNIAKAGYTVYEKTKKVSLLQKDLIELENQNKFLELEYRKRQGREHVELIARRDLLMAYPNENPTEHLLKTNAQNPESPQNNKEGEILLHPTPIYKLWLKIFGVSL